MTRRTMTLVALAIGSFALVFLFFFHCTPQVDEKPEPQNREDPAFLASLAKSGQRGPRGITIVAPASGLSEENAQMATEMAGELGVSLPAEALRFGVVPYTANSDAARLEELRKAMNNPETEVLWALAGGYGSGRLLAELAKTPRPETARVFIGYSDMTFLHLFFHQWGWRTVHGSMFWQLSRTEQQFAIENFRLLASLLAGELDELRYDGLEPFNSAAKALHEPLEAILVGGNLTCLAAAVGTPWSVQASGKILFLEDVNASGYMIDRTLVQLDKAGILGEVRAILLGDFTVGDDNVNFALERFARDFSKPVFKTDQFGHGQKNYPLILNGRCVIRQSPDNSNHFTLHMEAKQLP